MNNSPLVLQAISYAYDKHGGQVRKKSGLPYVVHLHGVALLVQVYKRSKFLVELICAAYMHDILEDTNTTREELERVFGPFITGLVYELTNDKTVIERDFGGSKCEYLKHKLVHMSNYALVLKLCDRLDNITSQPTQKVLAETKEILDYLEANRKLTKTQANICASIRALLPN